MHSAAAYPLLQSRGIPAPRVGLLTYARGVTFAFWMFCLQWPFWWIRDWTSWQEGLDFKQYYYIGFIVCAVAHLTVGIDPLLRAPFQVLSTWSGRFLTLFCAFALLLSPLSEAPSVTARYAVATWGIYVLLHLFWLDDYRVMKRMVVLAGFVILAWQVVLAARLGVRLGYGIGGILRNYTGQAGFTAMVCCLFSSRKSVRWGGIAAALGLSLMVNSRGSILAVGAFLIVYFALYSGAFRFVVYGLLGLLAFIGLLLIWPELYDLLANRVMRMNDAGRGVGSGLTGRWETFMNGIAAFWKSPIYGCGFRAAPEVGVAASHSGLIRLFVETGFVGGFLMLGSIGIEMVRRFGVVQQLREVPQSAVPELEISETMRVNVIVFATLFTTLLLWVYEPLYISFGSVSSLLFWLMMVAPIYVTSRGAPIQR
jgi:hypothetical protein